MKSIVHIYQVEGAKGSNGFSNWMSQPVHVRENLLLDGLAKKPRVREYSLYSKSTYKNNSNNRLEYEESWFVFPSAAAPPVGMELEALISYLGRHIFLTKAESLAFMNGVYQGMSPSNTHSGFDVFCEDWPGFHSTN